MIAGSVSKADELVETYERHLEKQKLTRLNVVQELKTPLHQRKAALAEEYIQRLHIVSSSKTAETVFRQNSFNRPSMPSPTWGWSVN